MLRELIRRIDGGPYEGYRRRVGVHAFGRFEIQIDHVPLDPLGGPARIRLRIAREDTGLPAAMAEDPPPAAYRLSRPRREEMAPALHRWRGLTDGERRGRSTASPGGGKAR